MLEQTTKVGMKHSARLRFFKTAALLGREDPLEPPPLNCERVPKTNGQRRATRNNVRGNVFGFFFLVPRSLDLVCQLRQHLLRKVAGVRRPSNKTVDQDSSRIHALEVWWTDDVEIVSVKTNAEQRDLDRHV